MQLGDDQYELVNFPFYMVNLYDSAEAANYHIKLIAIDNGVYQNQDVFVVNYIRRDELCMNMTPCSYITHTLKKIFKIMANRIALIIIQRPTHELTEFVITAALLKKFPTIANYDEFIALTVGLRTYITDNNYNVITMIFSTTLLHYQTIYNKIINGTNPTFTELNTNIITNQTVTREFNILKTNCNYAHATPFINVDEFSTVRANFFALVLEKTTDKTYLIQRLANSALLGPYTTREYCGHDSNDINSGDIPSCCKGTHVPYRYLFILVSFLFVPAVSFVISY